MARDYHLRRNLCDGILYKGYRYESIPQLPSKRFIAVLGVNGDNLIVSDLIQYGDKEVNADANWFRQTNRDRLKGSRISLRRIGVGRPTDERIRNLKDELATRSARKKD